MEITASKTSVNTEVLAPLFDVAANFNGDDLENIVDVEAAGENNGGSPTESIIFSVGLSEKKGEV